VTPAQEALRQAVGDLRSIKARWAVIGGMAVSVRAEPRFTKDVDFALAVASQEEADSVVFHLGSHGYEHQVTLAETATGQVSTVRLRHYRSTVLVDLLMGSCGIEPEIVASATRMEVVPRVMAPVACTGHLIAMKVLANRPHDLVDVGSLIAAATPRDLADGREAVRLIEARGFARGEDLSRRLEGLLANPPR
jgi:hypothetical protein